MSKTVLSLLLFSIFFSECLSYHTIKGNKTSVVDGRQKLENSKLKISIILYGDYWIHGFNKTEMLNWNESFVRKLNDGTETPRLIFAAHTTLDPFCSVAGLYYDKGDSNTINLIRKNLGKQPGAIGLQCKKDWIGMENFSVLSYSYANPTLKTNDNYLEYLCTNGKKLMRFIFWTKEGNMDWFESETKGIIGTLHWDY